MDFVERKIAVFKAGIHTDSAGRTRAWTTDDLAQIAARYNPAAHEAPVVIGHPTTNAPAFGWAKKLTLEGDTLWADAEIVPELDDLIRRGFYRKRSISLYQDGTLRHIGFLGATPPAVKGLPDIAFEDGEGTDYEWKEETIMTKFWEWLTAKAREEGVDLTPPPAFSETEIQARIDAEAQRRADEAIREKEAAFAEARRQREAELAAREAALREAEAASRRDATAQFCETLLREGRLTPALVKHGMGLQNFLEQIDTLQAPVEFGEGQHQTCGEFIRSFLTALPKTIAFNEVAGNEKDPKGSGDAATRLQTIITEKMKADESLTYGAAFMEAQRENPDLAAEYAAQLDE